MQAELVSVGSWSGKSFAEDGSEVDPPASRLVASMSA